MILRHAGIQRSLLIAMPAWFLRFLGDFVERDKEAI